MANAARYIILGLSCLVIAFLLQWVFGEGLVRTAMSLYPGQSSPIGLVGTLLIPHPLTGGVFLLPFTAWGVFAIAVRILRRRRILGFRPRLETNSTPHTDARSIASVEQPP